MNSSLRRLLLLTGILAVAFAFGSAVEPGLGTPQAEPDDPPPEKPTVDPEEDLLGQEDDLLGDDDDLLGQEDDLLDDEDLLGDDDEEPAPAGEAAPTQAEVDQAHAEVFLADRFPPATACATCHPKHYREWSVSQHAYAQMSPVFNAMHGTILKLTNGTNGDFCIRCHTPVGMNLGEPEFMSNIDRHPTSREGVTCIVCHRVNRAYGKVSGRLAIVEGDILTEVYGPTGNAELARVLDDPDTYRVVTTNEPGRKIHTEAVEFFQINKPGFCGTCHDVTLVNGFRLEEAFSAYKQSPAARAGVTCQDCHMATEPGVASEYERGPAALVGGVPTTERKLTNHYFAGPDYPIIHPGIFPHNARAIREESEKDDPTAEGMATIRDWLEFDVEAGWGTDAFEDAVPDDFVFPPRWDSIDDRYDARQIIDENLELLAWGHEQRLAILRVGYRLDEIETLRADETGIRFRARVRNGTDGHDVPTGFDAERLVFLQVTVTDRDGTVVMQSGDLDPNGDVRDLHSLYVHNGELPLDKQLFSLQSKFVTRLIRGGEREQVLAVNYSVDPLPFLRPEPRPTIVFGRPAGARKQRHTIPPLASRWANYRVDGKDLTGKGPYTANVRLIAAMIPINLLSEIMLVGFDYNMTPRELADGIRDGHMILWEKNVTFDVHAAGEGPVAEASRRIQ
jgi:hypothetical protein